MKDTALTHYLGRSLAGVALGCSLWMITTAGIAAESVAGITPGSLNVSQNGSADYTVPLSVPPGVNGLEPTLSLDYSSASTGEGHVGVGWSLGGLSVITRCAHTLRQDGFITTMNYDKNQQRYCIDGQRLVAADNKHSEYSFDNRTFHKEVDDYSKIVSNGTSGKGPATFTVYKKSGEILTYGSGTGPGNVKFKAQGRTDGTVGIWPLTKIEDRHGNAINFTYTDNQTRGSIHPHQIDYAYKGSTSHARVKFAYNTSSSVLDTDLYRAGSRSDRHKRLQKITTQVRQGAQFVSVKNYVLDFKDSTLSGRSLLASISECNGDESQCFNPLTFTWEAENANTETPGFERHSLESASDPHFAVNLTRQEWLDNDAYPLDFNGDGFSDLLMFPKKPEDSDKIWLFEGKRIGFHNKKNIAPELGFIAGSSKKYSQITVMDYDGDGKTDILISRLIKTGVNTYNLEEDNDGSMPYTVEKDTYSLQINAYRSTESGFSSPNTLLTHTLKENTQFSVDTLSFNGNHLPDLMVRLKQHSHVVHPNGKSISVSAASKINKTYVLKNQSSCNAPSFSKLLIAEGNDSTDFNWSLTRHHAHLFDYNGDGLTDILMQGIYGAQSYLLTNNGSASASAFTVLNLTDKYATNSASWSRHQIHTLDFNGDGLTDLLLQQTRDENSGTVLLVSTGSSQNEHRFYPLNITHMTGMSDPWWNNNYRKIVPYDFNRDGMTDLILQGTDQSHQSALLISTGKISGGPSVFPFKKVSMADTGYSQSNAWDSEKFSLLSIDFNNDGLTDLVQKNVANANVPSFVMLTRTNGFDRISTFKDSLGKKEIVTYKTLDDGVYVYNKTSSQACTSRYVKAPIHVVSRVESDIGLGGKTSTNDYAYQNLKYDAVHGAQGFKSVIVTHKTNNVLQGTTTTEYNQTFPLTGQVKLTKSQSIKPNGDTFDNAITDHFTISEVDPNNNRRYFVRNTGSQQIVKNENGDTVSQTNVTNSNFDAFGNVGKIVSTETDSTGTGTGTGTGTKTSTTTNVYTNNTTQWILGRLSTATVTHSATGAHFVSGNIFRKSTFGYDGVTGSLTRETVHYPGGKQRHTDYGYDDVGNIIKKTVSGSDITTRETNYEFGNQYGKRFETKTINALGHSETKTYDARFGVPLTLTGPNALTTTWEYDKFGRQVKEIRADGSWTKVIRYQSPIAISNVVIDTHKPNNTVLVERTATNTGDKAIVYSDLLGREIRSVAFGFEDKAIYVDSQYDNLGRLKKKSLPYFQGASPLFSVIEYDHRNRPKIETLPGNHQTSTNYLQDGTIETTNPEGQTSKSLTNFLDKLVKVTDPQGNVVNYQYDAVGNLRKTITGSATTIITYDGQGRKIRMSDPDMGIWDYEYNVLDQLIKQTDAKDQSTYFEYDLLGRKTKRQESAAGQSKAQGKATIWLYDDAPVKGIGKLFKKIGGDLKYQQHTHYDSFGRVSSVITRVDRNGDGALQSDELYRQDLTYENGRVKTVKNRKTGHKIDNTYNAAGQLTSVSRVSAVVTTPNAAQSFRQLADVIATQIQPVQTQIDAKQTTVTQHQSTMATLTSEASVLRDSAAALDTQVAQWLVEAETALGEAESIKALHGVWVPLPASGHSLLIPAFSAVEHKQAYIEKQTLYLMRSEQAVDGALEAQTARDIATAKETEVTTLTSQATTLLAEIETLTDSIRPQVLAKTNLERSADRIEKGQAPLAQTYWTADTIDAQGRVTDFTLGNGVTTERVYTQDEGFLTHIVSRGAGLGKFQHLRYDYNDIGMPEARYDDINNINEALVYDGLNRLEKSTVSGSLTHSKEYRYDALGNIRYKQDNGCGDTPNNTCYEYGSSRPHAVTKAGGVNYTYDTNGNMTSSSAGRLISWSTFNKPITLTQSAQSPAETNRSLRFDYGASHQRIRMQSISDTSATDLASVTETTWSLGGGYQQIERTGNIVEHHQSLSVPGATILVVRHDKADGSIKGESTLYLHHDNLGSTSVITGLNAAGNPEIIERQHYGAFGLPLKAGSLDSAKANSATTAKGYTGHEMLNAFGLIHMNARLYDPVLGRFLSPDTFVQSMSNTQSLNRYSYVLNNPLSYTDPSGHFFTGVSVLASLFITKQVYHWAQNHPQQAIMIASIAVGAGAGAWVMSTTWAAGTAAGTVGAGVAAGAAAGATHGGLTAAHQGSSITRGITRGGISGGIAGGFSAMGGQFGLVGVGVAGGLASKVQGGDFRSGFIAATISFGANRYLGKTGLGQALQSSPAGRAVMAAAIGGTASDLSGGDFANGARTAAFASLFQNIRHKSKQIRRIPGKIYVTGHRVAGVGPVHTAIEYINANGNVTVLSAGPKDGLLYSEVDANGFGHDAPADNFTVDVVNIPNGTSATQYVQRLISADSHYGDNLDYDLFPGISNSYNSNSYVRGLIQTTGGSTSVNLGNYYGGNDPVPSCYFSAMAC